MNDPFSRNVQFNSSGSGLGCLLTFVLVAALLSSWGLGWIVNGFIILLLMIPLAIALGIFGFQWWLKRNIIEDACPVCSYQFTGLNNSVARCPSCGEVVQIIDKKFQRQAEVGTVDVVVVDMDATDTQGVRTVDVQVLEAGED